MDVQTMSMYERVFVSESATMQLSKVQAQLTANMPQKLKTYYNYWAEEG